MKVSSKEGKGSTFRLLLPSAGAPVEGRAPAVPVESDWRGSGTVLVADDEASVRVVASRLLESFGYRIVLALDGADALERFRKAPADYAAVLLDLTMPKMDGIEAFMAMRTIRADIPIVLMSGYTEQDAVNRFTDGTPSAFVQKPFSPDELREAFRGLTDS